MLTGDILDVLSSGGVGTTATNLFEGEIPDAVNSGLGVIETGGIFPVHTFRPGSTNIGTPTAVMERPRFQVASRSPIYRSARAKIQDAFNLLDGLSRSINGVNYASVTAVQSPIYLGLDLNRRYRFVVNFDCQKAVSTSSST